MAGRYGKEGVIGPESFVGCSYTGLRRKKKAGQFAYTQDGNTQITQAKIAYTQFGQTGLRSPGKPKGAVAAVLKKHEKTGRKRISASVFTGAVPDPRYALLDTLGDEMAWISKIQIH